MDLSIFANKRLDTLKSLEDASVALLKSNKFSQALACMVQVLKCKSKSFGKSSKEVIHYLIYILKKFAIAVSKLIDQVEIEIFAETLNKIMVLTKTCRYKRVNKQLCKVIYTYSCVLRRIGSLSLAYDYALKAVNVGNAINGGMNFIVSVYLNICSILSQLNEHNRALEYCKVAVKHAEICLNTKKSQEKPEKFKENVNIASLAYYNLAVETEVTGNLKEAYKWFDTGLKLLEHYSSLQKFSMIKEFKIALNSITKLLNEHGPSPFLYKPLKTANFQSREVESPSIFPNTIDSWKKTMKIENKSKQANSSITLKSDIELNNSISSLPSISKLTNRSQSSKSINHKELVTKTNPKFNFNPSSIRIPKNSNRDFRIKSNSNTNKSFQTNIALIKIQAFIRMLKVRKWYKQYKKGKFTEKTLRCERIEKLGKWEILAELKKKTLICKIKVKDQFGIHKKKFSLFEICYILGEWTGDEFEKQFFKIFLCIKIEKNKVGLNRLSQISVKPGFTVVKNCDLGKIRIQVYLVCGGRLGQCLMFFPDKVNKMKVMGKILISRVKNVAFLMGIKEIAIYENFSNLSKFLKVLNLEGEIVILLEEEKDIETHKNLVEKKLSLNYLESNKVENEEVKNNKLLANSEKIKIVSFGFIKIFQHFLLSWKGRNFNTVIKKAFPSIYVLKKFENKIKIVIKSLFYTIFVQKTLNSVEISKPLILIQSFVRMHITRSYFLKVSEAVLICQRLIRGFLCRKRLRSQNLALKNNEIKKIPIDSKSEHHVSRLIEAVKLIQRHFKGYKIRRIFRFFLSLGLESSFSKVVDSVIIIQKHLRGFRVRKALQRESSNLLKTDKLPENTEGPKIPKLLQKKPEILQKNSESPIKPQILQKVSERSIKPEILQKKLESPAKPEILQKKPEKAIKPEILQKNLESPIKPKVFQIKPESLKNSEIFIKNNESPLKLEIVAIHSETLQKKTESLKKLENPKNINKGKEILIKGLGNSLISKLLTSAVTIQKYTRGWLCRKHLKIQIQLHKEMKAAICLQRFFRGWKARKELEELKTGVLVIEWSGLVIENIPYISNISKLADNYIVKVVNLQNFSALYLKVPATETTSIIFSRLSLSNGWLRLLETPKPQEFSHLLHQDKRVVSWDPFLIKVALEPSCISILVQGVSQTQFLKLGFYEIVERFSERFKAKELIDDLIIEPSRIYLSNQVIVLKKSKYFHEKLYTVNMFEKKSMLIFEVMFDSSLKKRAFVDLKEAQDKTGIFAGILALGTFIIDSCIAVHGKRVKINLKPKKSYGETEAVIKLQARVRAFLARKRVSRKNLVLVCSKEMNGKDYKLYCHYFGGNYNIIAVTKNESLDFTIEKKLPFEQILNYLRRKILPNLQVTKTIPYKLIMKITIASSEKMIFKPKVTHSSGQNKDGNPVNLLSLTSNQNFTDKKIEKMNFKHKKPPEIRIRRKQNSEIWDDQIVLNEVIKLPPPSTPTVSLNGEKTMPVEVIKSQEVEKHIFKSGITLSGIYLIITMQIQNNGIFIQGSNESGTIETELFVKLKNLETMKNKKIEKLCTNLLSKLKLVSSIDGKFKFSILENEDDDRDCIIYRRMHSISNKLFMITIYENARGVFLVASQGENQVFNLKIGKKRIGNSQIVQEELSILVKKLKIQSFLGQEMLVISA